MCSTDEKTLLQSIDKVNDDMKKLGCNDSEIIQNLGIKADHFNENGCAKKLTRDDRFLVSCFKDIKSKKKTNTLSKQDLQKILSKSINIIDNGTLVNNKTPSGSSTPRLKMSMETFITLKDERDEVCVRINELTKIMHVLHKKSSFQTWKEELEAEKILLVNEHKMKILMTKIRSDLEDLSEPEDVRGTLSLANFKFNLSNKHQLNQSETNFYVLLLSDGSNVRVSQIEKAVEGSVTFENEFKFDFDDTFKIKAQIFSMPVQNQCKCFADLRSSLRKKKLGRRTYELLYRDIYTLEPVAKRVFRSTFKLLGEFDICPNNFNDDAFDLKLESESWLENSASLQAKIENFTPTRSSSGILNVGTKFNDAIFWNRKYCVIDGEILKIYNSPTDEDPVMAFYLRNCNNVDEASRSVCPRSRCFIINECDEEKIGFFQADSSADLHEWISNLNSVINAMSVWKNFL